MLQLSQSQLEQQLSQCNLEGWPFGDRIEAMAYASNTLSGILTILEAEEGLQTYMEIFRNIEMNSFGNQGECRNTGNYYGAVAYQAKIFPRFSLFSIGEKEMLGIQRIAMAFSKTPRGLIFGDPAAARSLQACYNAKRSPIEVFTSAAKKGATRATTTSVKILSLLGELGELTEKEVMSFCFWKPGNRNENQTLKSRVNKNLFRLNDNGLVNLENIAQLYLYNKERGLKPEQIPPWKRYNGERAIKSTDAVTAFLYENRDNGHRVTDICEETGEDRARVSPILRYLLRIGFCCYENQTGKRSKIKLTTSGRKIAAQLALPIMLAAQKGFSWQGFKPLAAEEEYNNFWGKPGLVDMDYVLGKFREPLGRFSDGNLYVSMCLSLMEIDKNQNPWRK